MFSLFGKAIGATKGVANDMAGYLDDASDAVGGLGGGAGDAADGLGSAGKAAKELKKQLTVLPFDELNQLAKDTESASSGGGGGGGAGGGGGGIGGLGDLGIEDWGTGLNIDDSPVVQAINRWAARIREAFQKHQWANLGRIIAEGINSGFKYIYDILDWEKLKPKIVDGFITPFQTTFNSMMDWIDWKLIGATFARGLNVIVYTLRAWITGFHWRDYGGYLAEGMNSMINGIDADALGRLIADKFKIAWEFFGGWVRKFDFSNLGTKLKEFIIGALDELDPEDMGESLATLINGISSTIISLLQDGTVRESVSKAFVGFVNGFINELDADDVEQALSLVKETIIGVLGDLFTKVNTKDLGDKLATALSGLPWVSIAAVIGAKAGASLALGIFGTAFKLKAASIIAGVGAGGGGGAATAGGVASGVGGTVAGLTVSELSIIGAVSVGGIALGLWLKKQADESGLTKLFQLNTKENKKTSAQNTAEGARKNQQALDKAGMNGAGYNTSIQTVPNQPSANGSNTKNTVTTVMKGVTDGSFKNLQIGVNNLKKDPTITKFLAGQQTGSYKSNKKDYNEWVSGKVTKTSDSKKTSAYNSIFGHWTKWQSGTIKKTTTSAKTSAYNTIFAHWTGWKGQSVTKTTLGKKGTSYINVNGHWVKWDGETVTKTADAERTDAYIKIRNDWNGFSDKFIKAYVTADLSGMVKRIEAIDKSGDYTNVLTTHVEYYNAKGGLFTGPLGFQVFGEAGDEAAIPLERKSTMKKIASAIVNSGGMSTSNSDDIADAIAMRVLPVMAEMINGANNRPVNVNATLYTENNEVLARAVNKGNRSLDKRYNPVSQFSY